MSYKRLTDEELERVLKLFEGENAEPSPDDLIYRALRELAELRQAAEPPEPKPLPEDYWETAG